MLIFEMKPFNEHLILPLNFRKKQPECYHICLHIRPFHPKYRYNYKPMTSESVRHLYESKPIVLYNRPTNVHDI